MTRPDTDHCDRLLDILQVLQNLTGVVYVYDMIVPNLLYAGRAIYMISL